MKKIQTVDLIKGVGMILVYLGHSFQFKGVNFADINETFNYIHRTIYSFHMPLFFIVSGFLSPKIDKNFNVVRYYRKKINRLFIPYIVINILDIIARKIFSNYVNCDLIDFKELLFHGTKVTWFIYVLLIILLLYPVLSIYLLKGKKNNILLIIIILIFLNYLGIFGNIRIFSLNTVIYYLIYFFMGNYLQFIYQSPKLAIKYRSKYLSIIASVVFFGGSYKWYDYNLILQIFFAVLGSIVLLKGTSLTMMKVNSFIKFIGVNSLMFYLLEGFIAVPIRILLYKMTSQEYLLVASFFLIKIILGYTIVRFIVLKNKYLGIVLGSK